jgi:hypothetical protein
MQEIDARDFVNTLIQVVATLGGISLALVALLHPLYVRAETEHQRRIHQLVGPDAVSSHLNVVRSRTALLSALLSAMTLIYASAILLLFYKTDALSSEQTASGLLVTTGVGLLLLVPSLSASWPRRGGQPAS